MRRDAKAELDWQRLDLQLDRELEATFPASDALKITERYTRIDRDQLNYEAVLEDPKVLTKPYTMRATLMLREDTRLREYSCVENNIDPSRYEKLMTDPSKFTRTPTAAQ